MRTTSGIYFHLDLPLGCQVLYTQKFNGHTSEELGHLHIDAQIIKTCERNTSILALQPRLMRSELIEPQHTSVSPIPLAVVTVPRTPPFRPALTRPNSGESGRLSDVEGPTRVCPPTQVTRRNLDKGPKAAGRS